LLKTAASQSVWGGGWRLSKIQDWGIHMNFREIGRLSIALHDRVPTEIKKAMSELCQSGYRNRTRKVSAVASA